MKQHLVIIKLFRAADPALVFSYKHCRIAKKSKTFTLFVCLLWILCSTNLIQAQSDSPPAVKPEASRIASQLDKVRIEIKRETERAEILKKRQTEIQAKLADLEKSRNVLSQEKENIQKELDTLNAESEAAKTTLEQSQAQVSTLRARVGKRIAATYKMRRRTAAIDYLFRAISPTDLLKRAYYLSLITSEDQVQLSKLTDEIKHLEETEQQIRSLKKRKETQLSRAEEVQKKLEAKKLEHAVLLREGKEKESLALKSLQKLQASAASLEAVVAGLTGGEEEPARVSPPDKPKQEQTSKVITSSANEANVTALTATETKLSSIPFQGEGLRKLKGQLDFPVSGLIIQHYGKQQHDVFADLLFVKGLEVQGEAGGEARAVAAGKVIFDDSLPGYGKVVIIDHGQRFYTLYGRLEKVLCRLGDLITSGKPVGILGEADAKGRNFYFELRIQGKASNPAEYFRKLPPNAN